MTTSNGDPRPADAASPAEGEPGAPDVAAPDGALSNGAVPNGVVPNGMGSYGAGSNGVVSDGAVSDGAVSDGAVPERALVDGAGAESATAAPAAGRVPPPRPVVGGVAAPRAGGGVEVVRRPPGMLLGATFLTIAALPSIMVGGVIALLVGPLGDALRDRIAAAAGTTDPDAVVLAARIAGAVALVAGVLFIALAWLAVKPKRWARSVAAALAVVEMALLVVGMVATAPDPVSIGLTLLAGAGVALLYLPRAEEFLLSQG